MRPPPTLARERLLHLIGKIAGRRIVVVGDVILDRYLTGDTDRISPEAPVPVVLVRDREEKLGGAANVAANVTAIGAHCTLVGAVGDDQAGIAVRSAMVGAQLDERFVVTIAERPTTSKTRIMARGQQVVRVDDEVETPLEADESYRLAALALDALADADALLLEDYNKGTLTPELISQLIAAGRKRGIPIVVDPKFRQFFDYAGATVFKPNRRELEAALGAAFDLEHQDAFPAALGRLAVDNLVVTLGADGMVVVTKDGAIAHIPSIARQVFDVSGAGDTVTAWMGSALAAGATLREAAQIANLAAGIEVGKAGVATVTPQEVIALHEERFDQLGRLRRSGLI